MSQQLTLFRRWRCTCNQQEDMVKVLSFIQFMDWVDSPRPSPDYAQSMVEPTCLIQISRILLLETMAKSTVLKVEMILQQHLLSSATHHTSKMNIWNQWARSLKPLAYSITQFQKPTMPQAHRSLFLPSKQEDNQVSSKLDNCLIFCF